MREQHLGTAVEFATHGLDLLHPIVLGANANGVPWILEFPFWQAATALLMKAFGIWYGWGNVVSLFCLFSSLWPLHRLARRFVSERAAWWALAFFLAQPLTWIWGGMAGTDSLSAASAVWFMYFAAVLLDTRAWRWWPAAVLAGVVCVLMKLPFFMTAGLMSLFYLWQRHRASRVAWAQLVSVGAMATVAFLLWNRHANYYHNLAEFPCYDLRMTGRNSFAYDWWFGRWETLASVKYWARGLWHLVVVFFGSAALLALVVCGWFMRDTKFLRWWLGAGIITTAVFTNVIMIHHHYHFLFSAPVVLLAARAIQEFEPVAWRFVAGRMARLGVLLFFFAVNVAQGLFSVHVRYFTDDYSQKQGALIRQHTMPSDKIIVWGQLWGRPFMHAHRQGLNTVSLVPLLEPAKLERLKQLGFTHVALMNHSPMEIATARVSSGRSYTDLSLSALVPEPAKNWPVVLSTRDLLILRIP